MRTISVLGPGASELVGRLAPALDGRVATVERLGPADAGPPPDARSAYGLAPDGSWVGAGADRSLDALLDDLAPDHDVALLAGFPAADAPAVVLDDADEPDRDRDVLVRAPDADAVAADAVREALADVAPRVTLAALVDRATDSPAADRAGAVATFTGRVRAHDDPDDPRTVSLEFERYDGVAAERTATIREELTAREGVFEVLLHHRTGVVPAGEDVVFVVVLAGHRREAFRAVEDGIDRLKAEVPLFKKETTVEDEFWRHER